MVALNINKHCMHQERSESCTCPSFTMTNDALEQNAKANGEYKMFCRIINKGMVIKSQQKDEKDLMQDEKINFLRTSFEKNKESFLFKFGKCLSISDLQNFEDTAENSDCKYYIRKLTEDLDPSKIDARVKNRRYNYLKRKLKNSSYFSEDEMKNRSPLLYRQYIDQYKTEEDRLKEKEQNLSENTLSQFLFGTIDKKIYEARCKLEEAQQEEFDESDDEENDPEFEKYMQEEEETNIPNEERERLRTEFISLMEERFLMGDDCDFDYSQIDNNEQYDDIYDQDLEDSYFDCDN